MSEVSPKMGIYAITNKTNGHRYIGSSINIHVRWRDHRRKLRRNTNGTPILQNAWDKYGEDAFEFSIVERVEDINELLAREQYYIDEFVPEYNSLKNAASMLGYRHTEETRAKFRKRTISVETREKIRQTNLGRKASEESRAKRKLAMNTPEARARMRKARASQGPRSEEGRQRFIDAQRIIQNTPEMKERQRKASLGIPMNMRGMDDEARLKRNQKLRERKRTPEQIERMREAQQRPEVQAIKREKQRAYWQRRKALEAERGDVWA